MKRMPVAYILVGLFTTQFACSLTATLPEPTLPTEPAAVVYPTITAESTEIPKPADTRSPEPTRTSPSVTETSLSSPISLDVLKNFTYWVEDFNTLAVLQDGVFANEKIQGRLIEPAAFGDLNGDGQQDAAVILEINSGGTGRFFDLIALLNQDGAPTQAGFTAIGDRQVINRLEIADGRIILDYLTQPLDGPLCCPNEHRLRSYVMDVRVLRLASEQILDSPTAQATPLPNAILIELPATGGQLVSPQQVSGRVSQVPPQGILNYRITDMKESLLLQGEVPVKGEPGGPGTFTFQFSLDAVSPGLVCVEIVDSANGILRGRSTVVLIAQ